MEEQVTRLVDKAWAQFQEMPPHRRLLIGICGIPGSGKTTLASIITSRLNERHQRHFASDIAAFVPMDGYHLSRAQLAALPDPARAFARRGAPFTFDGAGFVSLVQQLHTPLFHRSPTIYAPAFDHALQDPTPHAIALTPQTRIVVFEGNYLALRDPPWPEAARLLDELWFVRVPFEVARRRLVRRHLTAGIAGTVEEARRRVDQSDLVNGRLVVDTVAGMGVVGEMMGERMGGMTGEKRMEGDEKEEDVVRVTQWVDSVPDDTWDVEESIPSVDRD